MDYFPLYADLRGQACLVVGGGAVALRKVRALRGAGARVTVNAPRLHPALQALAEDGQIAARQTGFDPGLVAEHLLVIAATDQVAVNQAVAAAARAAHRLCNVVDDGPASGFIMPAVVDRSPVIVAVSSGGVAPVLARILRQRLDAWLPARLGELARWVARWRAPVAARWPDLRQRLRGWQALLDGDAAREVLSGNAPAADAAAAALLEGDAVTSAGVAWLVGAGPGDPGLLTRRGAELLAQADAVLYDALVPAPVLALARRDADLVCVGKRAGAAAVPQEEIHRELVRRVRRGQRVCRLKGGDPLIFGRGGEELEALDAAGLDWEVVPGVTAASACAAAAGIPLTHRDQAHGVSFVTGHAASAGAEPDWAALGTARHTLVIYMGLRRLEPICSTLINAGRPAGTPATLVARGSRADQQILRGTLASLPGLAAGAPAPALLIVGDVAGRTPGASANAAALPAAACA